MTPKSADEPESAALRRVRTSWGLLAAAFSDDTAGARWYLHVETGEIIRVVETDVSPGEHLDKGFVGIERARSKEQYRWMQRFIASLEDRALAVDLMRAISGKNAFRRFRNAISEHPKICEEWHVFRGDQLHRYIVSWLKANGLVVPPSDPVLPLPAPGDVHEQASNPMLERLDTATRSMSTHEIVSVLALAELLFLNAQARLRAIGTTEQSGVAGEHGDANEPPHSP